MMLLAAEFGRLGVGRVRLNEFLTESTQRWSEKPRLCGHHMGTTRMSESPKSGVVDVNCRAWNSEPLHRQQLGVPDLWIRESHFDDPRANAAAC